MKSLLACFAIAIVMLCSPRQSAAQFTQNSLLLGPHIGIGFYGGGLAFGAMVEKGFLEPGKFGPGQLGISGRFDYTSFGDSYDNWTFISIGAFLNYHFSMDSKTWDPFISLGLVYEHWGYSSILTAAYGYVYPYSSGITIAGNAGVRYFLSSNLALRALVGFGVTLLAVGLDFGI